MPTATHKFQSPKGTRDFYPPDMAVRRYLESVWRDAAVRHGFDEIDGPTFEHLELYTVKSGEGIVSELFSFRRAGGDVDYALRPEFTPTLARMVATRAAQLPRPIRWFAIPSMFRAERPQRGRLREHFQWNVDVIGDETARAEAEIIEVAVAAFRALGFGPDDLQVHLSHRGFLETRLVGFGVAADRVEAGFALVDAVKKLPPDEFRRRAVELGIDEGRWDEFESMLRRQQPAVGGFATDGLAMDELAGLHEQLAQRDLLAWCTYAPALARGLAYYTGTVFEVFETTGTERAIAGGGRYDKLIELFGGPALPAVGFGMGDVVIRLVLEERGLLEPAEHYLPRPDVFVVNARDDDDVAAGVIAALRRDGLHVRHSSRATRNVGKLLGEAGKCRARFAVIVGAEHEAGRVSIKDLDGGGQEDVAVDALSSLLSERLSS